MSDENTPDSATNAAEETINERIARGKATGRHYDGAIVPYPPGVYQDAVLSALTGREKASVDKLLQQGFRVRYHEYRSDAGELLMTVLRFDHASGEKRFKPVRYCGEFPGKGRVFWTKALDRPWPVYGLDRLAARPDARVIGVEGEKTADGAQAIFVDDVVVTWPSGASNPTNVELLALAGREIILWPDNDEAGRKAMLKFAAAAYEAGASRVSIVDVPPEFGEKWDLADPVPAAAEHFDLIVLLETARLVNPEDVAHLTSDARAKAGERRLLGRKPGFSRVDIEAAATALSILDPDMNGDEWRQEARRFFYAFGDRGLESFDSWSSRGEKYKDGEVENLWEYFRAKRQFRGESLMGLFRKAQRTLRERKEGDGSDRPNVTLDLEAMKMAAIEELNEDHAVVVRGSKTGVLRETYDPRFSRYGLQYLSKRDFVDLHVCSVELPADDEDQNKSKNKRVKQGELWFSSPWRRSYPEGVIFAPGQKLGPRSLNSWRGFAVLPESNLEGWSKFKHHLFHHVAGGDQASYDYILNWLACAVQRLNRPMITALILLGPKGAGKSVVIQLFGHLFGEHTFVTSRMDDATGRFNDRLETTLLLGLEEAVAPQDRAADGTLKDLITRDTLRLEGKFFGVWTAPNHLRIIVTSNNEHVVRADALERRYAVFQVANPHQADPDARRRYFGEMVQQMESGGYEAMLGELLEREISDWNPERIPETEALRRQKEINQLADPVCSFLYERLMDGTHITTGEGSIGSPIYAWGKEAPTIVHARDLIAEFAAYCETRKLPCSSVRLARELARYLGDNFRRLSIRSKTADGSELVKAYEFPPLEDARRAFEDATALRIERDEEEPEPAA